MPGKHWQTVKSALPAPCVLLQLLVVVVLFLLSLLAMADETTAPARTLHRGNSAEPVTLDPHQSEDVATGNIARDLFEGLTSEARDGSITPGLAARWDISDDGRTYTFYLRENLAWSNGEALSTADIIYSFRRAIDPATGAPMADLLLPIINAPEIMQGQRPVDQLGIKQLDERTLVITLSTPTPWLLEVLSHPIAAPVHAKSLSEHGGKAFTPGKLISNGAYRLSAWSPYERIILKRNKHYYANADSWFDSVVYYPIDNNNLEFNRYRAGELDWTDTIPPNKLAMIHRDLPGQDFISPYLGTYYYGFNLTRPPFKGNPSLRRALSLAIDRNVITKKLLGNGELPAERWLPPGLAGRPDQTTTYKQDRRQQISEAKRLYQEAGYGPSRPLNLTLHYNSSEQNKRIAVAISAMWKSALGIKTELVNEEWKVFLANRKGKVVTQAYRASWIADFNDASSFLALFTAGHIKNDTGYANATYDALVNEINFSRNADNRSKLINQAEQLLLDDQVIMPIYHYVSRHLVKPDIRGYETNPLDHHYTKHLSRHPAD